MGELTDGFMRAMNARADARHAPSSPRSAMERFGWTTRDVAQRFGVSERTARRWRQQDRIPEKRAADWREAMRDQQRRRTRRRIEQRGISQMSVTGTYRISRSRYKSHSWSPVRILPGNKISGATMRDVFDALDRGEDDEAEGLLGDALSEAYGAPGIVWEDVEGVDFDIG